MKPKLGICIWSIPAEGNAAKIELAARLGLQGIELGFMPTDQDRFDLEMPETLALFKIARQTHAFTYTALAINQCCRRAMTDPSEHKYLFEVFERAIDTAAALEIPLLQIPSFIASDIKDASGFGATVACLRHACDKAAEKGILVASENALDQQNLRLLLDSIDAPNFRIYFDTANPMTLKGLEVAPLLEEAYGQTVEVHLKDGFRDDSPALLGHGDVRFETSAAFLTAQNYGGWMHLENSYTRLAKIHNRSGEDLIRDDLATIERLFG